MYKLIFLFSAVCFVPLMLHAQWSEKDSLNLDRLLKSGEDIKIDPQRFMQQTDKPWMKFDTKLPGMRQKVDVKDLRISLAPYSIRTPYNYDPIYRKKIEIGPNTWRGDPFYSMTLSPLKTRFKEDEAAPISSRGNMPGPSAGAVFTGDLLYYLTKEFWSFKHRRDREATLKALSTYGDSLAISPKK
jgi:hypothetical protein